MTIELGKIPPQSIDLEKAIIGGILLEKDSLIDIVDILKPESFYHDGHQKIYKAIVQLFANNEDIDLLTISDRLRKNKHLDEIGGYVYLTELTMNIGSAAHIEFHARIVQQKFMQRELIRASTEIQNKAFDESVDVAELLDFSENELFQIANGTISTEAKLIGDIGAAELKRLEEIANSDSDLTGTPSGFVDLDRVTNGWQSSNLIVIGARPAMGKTTFALMAARNCAIDHKKPVAFFSLEMGADEIYKKILSCETGINSQKLRSANLTSEEWSLIEYKQRVIEDAPFYIDDTPGINPLELRAKCRRLKMKHDIQLVIVDYIQLMSSSVKGNREQEISSISRSLKILAKELNVPVIALSQLSRSVESTPDKKPMLSHLRESGAIEQDADIVMFIYRAYYYGFETFEDNSSTSGIMELLIRKFRAGELADIKLKHDKDFMKITDLDYIKPLEDINPEDNSDLKPEPF